MSTNHILRAGAVVAGACALALTATSAHASSPSTAPVGGAIARTTHSYVATSTGTVGLTVDADPTGTTSFSCTAVDEIGATDTPTGTYPPTTFATVDAGGAWIGCTGLGLNMSVTHTTWHVGVTGATVAGVTPEIIPDIHAEVQDLDFGGLLCDFDVDGSVSGSFDNATQDLTIDSSNLTVTVDPDGTGADCVGQIKDGGAATFDGTFHVS